MSKPKILLQFDSDPHASVFDAVTAVDSGIDQLVQYHNLESTQVRDLVHGAMFTRGPDDLKSTAIFIGGSDVTLGQAILGEVTGSFFGPMRVSVMLDANGANTTAATAVHSAARHVDLSTSQATVLAATGPVGLRAARLLAGAGAKVRVASRSLARAKEACDVLAKHAAAELFEPISTDSPAGTARALAGSQILIAAGAAGIELVAEGLLGEIEGLKVAIDLNAVPPLGIAGVKSTAKAEEIDGVIAYGAIGVGGLKMKIHKAAIRQLFEQNDQVFDAEEIFEIGKQFD
jgi:hypothetical protein